MAIVRSKPVNSFTVLNNAMLNDARLSFDDLGLLVYLLSKPAHWKISVAALQAERKHGRDWIYKRLSNLVEAGYMVRLRSRGENGTLGEIDYHVYDMPQQAEPLTENPDVVPLPEKPDLAKPDTAEPDLANPTLESNECKKELISEKELKTSTPPARTSADRPKSRKRDDFVFTPPEWLSLELFSRFAEERKRRRKPMSEYAMHLAVIELEKLIDQGQDQDAVINQSIMRGWDGLFPVKDSYPVPAARAPVDRASAVTEHNKREINKWLDDMRAKANAAN